MNERTNEVREAGSFLGNEMSKKCECGAVIDLTGLGSLAKLVDTCPECSDRINSELAQENARKREEGRKARNRKRAEEQWLGIVPKRYRETDEDHPDFPRRLHDIAKLWASGVFREKTALEWFGIIGESGRGKTRVMSRVMKLKIEEGLTCEWVNSNQFQWCAQHQHDKEHGEKAQRHLKSYRKCDFLAFDDLGKQKWTDTVESFFFDLLEERYAECKSMIWTANSDLPALEAMLSPDRAKPISGRLSEASNIVEL